MWLPLPSRPNPIQILLEVPLMPHLLGSLLPGVWIALDWGRSWHTLQHLYGLQFFQAFRFSSLARQPITEGSLLVKTSQSIWEDKHRSHMKRSLDVSAGPR